MADAPADKQLVLQKIYLKDASLEIPKAPQVFTRQWQPQIDVQITTGLQGLSSDQYQVLLSVTITAKLGEDIAFLAEVHQAGIFQIKGFSQNEEKQKVLGTECPNALFPYAREALCDLIQRGGFPQFLLQPVNFEVLYAEHRARSGEQTAKAH